MFGPRNLINICGIQETGDDSNWIFSCTNWSRSVCETSQWPLCQFGVWTHFGMVKLLPTAPLSLSTCGNSGSDRNLNITRRRKRVLIWSSPKCRKDQHLDGQGTFPRIWCLPKDRRWGKNPDYIRRSCDSCLSVHYLLVVRTWSLGLAKNRCSQWTHCGQYSRFLPLNPHKRIAANSRWTARHPTKHNVSSFTVWKYPPPSRLRLIIVLSLDVMDASGEIQSDVASTMFKTRLDADGNSLDVAKMDLGFNYEPPPSDYCGPCYGGKSPNEDGCCNTCKDVRDAYQANGWAIGDYNSIEQCAREQYSPP